MLGKEGRETVSYAACRRRKGECAVKLKMLALGLGLTAAMATAALAALVAVERELRRHVTTV